MRHVLRGILALITALTVATSAAGAGKMALVTAGSGPLQTGFAYTPLSPSSDDATQFERMRAAGATYVRISVSWSSIAPGGATMPSGFVATNPYDPNYNWSGLDSIVMAATDAGLQPIIEMQSAPIWAQGTATTRPKDPGGFRPDPSAFRDFMTAAVERYSGSDYAQLPRVRYWSIWNEPNLTTFLSPQVVGGKPYAPIMYRALINAAAGPIHSIPGNVVIAGETSPYGGPAVTRAKPLTFMENVLCVSEKYVKPHWVYKSSCSQRTRFDVWSQHPYTEGGPTRKGRLRGNVSLGDLGDMRMVLNTAIKAGHVNSSQKVGLWVTEFSWDTKPPDPGGVSPQLEARWVSHALYVAWSAGVNVFSWFIVRDLPFSTSYYQSGLYYDGAAGVGFGKPKPALTAFRFPFVAFAKPQSSAFVWGRTPNSKAGSVLIERKSGSAWVLAKRLSANRFGIFKSTVKVAAKTTYLRARFAGSASLPFSLIPPKKTWTGCVFGTIGGDYAQACKTQKG